MSGSSSNVPPIAPIEPIEPIPKIDKIPDVPDIGPVDAPAPVVAPVNIKKKKAIPFFLSEIPDSNLMKKRGPVVEAASVSPLIDGEEIFKELETQIAKAKASVLIAFWSIDPEMKLVSNNKKRWGDLLLETANRGVMVRVFWTDFDPGLKPLEHFLLWLNYKKFVVASTNLPIDRFQVLCSRHEVDVDVSVVSSFLPGIYDNLPATITKLISDEAEEKIVAGKLARKEKDDFVKARILDYFDNAPGIWDKIEIDTSDIKLLPKTSKKDYPIYPAVHHQKTVIIDGNLAYTGGLNITDAYHDTRKHGKKVNPKTKMGPWHDLFVKVEGSFAVQQFIDNYIGLWNQERRRSVLFLDLAYKSSNIPADRAINTRITTDLTSSMISASLTGTSTPAIPSQVRRTVSIKSSSPLSIYQTNRKDILEGYILAIQQAEEYIYIENQYFREKEIADAIIAQHAKNPDLRTIIVLPRVAEELLTAQGDILSKHGAHLQHGILNSMKTAIAGNLGLFTLVRKDNVQIYVHSKLILVDDKFGSIGSANANPRSFKVDTELDFVWYDEVLVKKLREDLWNELMGKPKGMKDWKMKEIVKEWTKIASKNRDKGKKYQKGFIFPFENATQGEKSLLPIDDFV